MSILQFYYVQVCCAVLEKLSNIVLSQYLKHNLINCNFAKFYVWL